MTLINGNLALVDSGRTGGVIDAAEAYARELQAEWTTWGMMRALEALALLGADFGRHDTAPERETVTSMPSQRDANR